MLILQVSSRANLSLCYLLSKPTEQSINESLGLIIIISGFFWRPEISHSIHSGRMKWMDGWSVCLPSYPATCTHFAPALIGPDWSQAQSWAELLLKPRVLGEWLWREALTLSNQSCLFWQPSPNCLLYLSGPKHLCQTNFNMVTTAYQWSTRINRR